MTTDGQTLAAIIVGTGFAGLAVGMGLRRAKTDDFLMLEREQALGGAWRDNTYPGCACDVESNLYSFAAGPQFDWTRTFASQSEIRGYLEKVAARYDLNRHIRYGQDVASATWDAAARCWQVRTSAGVLYTARALILACGAFHTPKTPKIRGLERFRGASFHSARWDASFSPNGKRILVLGTGASAIQFVPKIQPHAQRLFVVQRTPPWVLPRNDRAYSALERSALRSLPGLRQLYRLFDYCRREILMLAFKGHGSLMPLIAGQCKRHLARSVSDPALRESLTPDYQPGCKRILLSDDYYPALVQSNVEVISQAVVEVGETQAVLADGRKLDVDAIIFGTGFEMHRWLSRTQVFGEGGRELGATWQANGAKAYLGTMVAGFPNMFMMTGPNTGVGHNSMIAMIEAQAGYVCQAMGTLSGRPNVAIQPKPDVQRDYNRWLEHRHSTSVWLSGCESWYLDERGHNTTLWPGFTTTFRWRLARMRAEDHVIT